MRLVVLCVVVVAMCLVAPRVSQGRARPAAAPILDRMRRLSFMIADAHTDRVVRQRLRTRLARTTFVETAPGDPAFGRVVDKGKELHLCVLDNSGRPERDEYIVRALVHELAHVASISVGHTSEFQANETALVETARRLRLLPDTELPGAMHCGAFV